MILRPGDAFEWKDWRDGRWRRMVVTQIHERKDDGTWLGRFEELPEVDTEDPRFQGREVLRISTTELRCLWPTRKRGPDQIRPLSTPR